MTLPPVIRDAIRLLFLAILEHQYVVLFGVVAIEEAGVPLPAPTDVVIAFFGYRARGDIPELAQVVLVCALASTVGTLVPYFLARRFGSPVAHRLASIYWTFWVTIGAALGPMFRRIAGPYITYVLIALPVAVIAFFVYRHLRARRKWASPPTRRI